MPVLSIDLAYRRWSDLGIVVLDRAARAPSPGFATRPYSPEDKEEVPGNRKEILVRCEIISWRDAETLPGPVDPDNLAGRLNHLCNLRGIHTLLLDGPQAWKSHHNGLKHARLSEWHLNTAAKTGLPGMVKPITYRTFSEFSLDVYDALCRRGWSRLGTPEKPGPGPERVLVESYPCAAWRSLGLPSLPSKRRARVSDIATAFAALQSMIPLTVNQPPNHDQLQAIVGGLPGLALAERDHAATRIVGTSPRREDGHWREGFIVLPLPPGRTPLLRWLT